MTTTHELDIDKKVNKQTSQEDTYIQIDEILGNWYWWKGTENKTGSTDYSPWHTDRKGKKHGHKTDYTRRSVEHRGGMIIET